MITISAIVPAFAQVSAPSIVARNGYINGTPLTTHTTTSFNSTGASTLVAFVSTNTPWIGLSASINGVSDSAGNTWTALVGPTLYGGTGSFPLLSGIYYVISLCFSSDPGGFVQPMATEFANVTGVDGAGTGNHGTGAWRAI